MSPEWQWVAGIVMCVIGFVLTTFVAVVGWLIKDRLSSIGEQLKPLPKIETELAEVKVTQKHHSEKQDEFCHRLEKVETHVSNTERIALMELRLTKAEEEIIGNRKFGHWVRNVLAAIAGKVGAELPKEN
jgi:hypothetical protein